MAVAHSTATESHTGSTGSTSEAFFDISVPFTSSHKGLLVFTFVANAAADDALSVKIDPAGANTDVPAVSGGRATDTVTEPGDCKAWFLGTGLPTTTTTVRVNRNNNANVMYAVALTVTALGDTEVHTAGIVLLQENSVLGEQNVDDGSPGTDSLRYVGLYHGSSNIPTVGANTTAIGATGQIDLGVFIAATARETTAGQGSRPVGYGAVTADDTAAVHLAVREVPAGGTTVTPAVIAITASLPTPAVLAASTVTPAVVAAVAALPTPSALAASRVTPAVIPITAALPQPTILAASRVTPAVIPLVTALPTPTILAGAQVAPAVISLIVTLPTPTIDVAGGATTVTPAVIPLTVTLPTPAILAAAKVLPAVIPLTVSLPTPQPSIPGVTTPTTIVVAASLPTPTILAAVQVSPATIAILVGVPTPVVIGATTVMPATILITVTLPTPTIILGAMTFWRPNPVAYVLAPVGYDPITAGDTPPPW